MESPLRMTGMSNSKKLTTFRLMRLGLLSALLGGIASPAVGSAQELSFSEQAASSGSEIRSNTRRAATPANRNRPDSTATANRMSITQKSRMNIQVEPNDAPPARLVSTADESVMQSPVPIPDAAADVNAGEAVEFDTVLEPQPLPAEAAYAQEWSFGNGANCDCGCDSYACDGSCGMTNCDSWDYGAPSCFSFVNPLCDPGCFGYSLLNRMQFRVSYVNFWKNDANIPVLAADATGTRLFGGGPALTGSQDGLRGEISYWIDNVRQRALWLRLYDSGHQSESAEFNSNNSASVVRPFIVPPATNSSVVVVPGGNSRLSINLKSAVEGGDLLVRHRINEDELVRTDLLWGYQHIRFVESLTINTVIPPLEDREYFATSSQFTGGALGLARSAHDGCWYFDGFAKIGFGNMNRQVLIDNTTTAADGGTLFIDPQTNERRFENDTFVFTPELGINAGYKLTNNLHFIVGYTFLRLPKVTRVQDALPPGLVTSTAAIRTTDPRFQFTESNLNVQMLDLGIQYRY